MAKKNKYEQLYQEGRNVCGLPFPEFVQFFEGNFKKNVSVLDLGCGQGRDALFIARMGHEVLGVDLSPTGIAQMLADARKENLKISGVVADIVTFEPERDFDVVVMDRVLHMFADDEERTAVLVTACVHTKPGGFILIADTPKQKSFLKAFFAGVAQDWQLFRQWKNFLIVQKNH
ncbi:MAG: class I SAM-dependent methyltransferase [Ardenticatenaceae bacterium]|nr:class I SAM-dependent methyltransferase [Ardenticatenaceae bacterium]MCB9445493.1 class I SAM-dependent methyltransferase [Ardenticatenaceae bacterium]